MGKENRGKPIKPKPLPEKRMAYGGVEISRKQLESCCQELATFVVVVGALLKEVEEQNAIEENFRSVAEKFVKVKGSARMMNLEGIARLAELSEELAIKGAGARSRPVVRRLVGALWDAVTTIKYMLNEIELDTSEEASLLIKRLEKALESLGGAREKISQDEIDQLFRA